MQSEGRKESSGCDATLVVPVSGHANIAVLTPRDSPANIHDGCEREARVNECGVGKCKAGNILTTNLALCTCS